jgi:hypothetical protein
MGCELAPQSPGGGADDFVWGLLRAFRAPVVINPGSLAMLLRGHFGLGLVPVFADIRVNCFRRPGDVWEG